MPDNPIVDMARTFRDELEALDEEALTRIITAYSRIYRTLQDKIDALLLELQSMESPSVGQVSKLARFRELETQIIEEVTRFQSYLRTEILNSAELSFSTASDQSQQLVTELLSQAGVTAQLSGLPANAFEVLVGFLQDGSPLYNRIELLAGTVADYVRDTLLEAVALGYNPRKTASLIQDAFGRGLTDALRMTRTAQIWASRVATQANYQNAGDVLDGWVWYAQLDDSTCQSCVVQHGTIHPLDELLNDHHNGRCAMLPYIEAFGNPVEQDGVTWFESLSETQQRKILGAGKYDAWKAGQFSLDQLSKTHNDEVYGDMRIETPLKELVKG